ncbi:MAG TPA: glycerol-3-phosphate 1-O-acyltransferase PlsB [Gammaproteobacteria bacterium]|nr:glycerol-3-phosphate 1-O-acyltransferase PlsB [Gammaproteobacteria bacterium]
MQGLAASLRAAGAWCREITRRLALLAVRYELRGEAAMPAAHRVCYVLETERLLDQMILEDLCRTHGFRVPVRRFPSRGETAGIWSVRTVRGWLLPRAVPGDLRELGRLFAEETAIENDVCFIPVTILWGRAPSREHSWLELLFSESWNPAGRVRALLRVAVHGRNVFVKVGEPIPLSSVAGADLDCRTAARRMSRVLRSFFHQQRAASIGPDLSHRRLLLDAVLGSPSVEAEVARTAAVEGRGIERVRARARRYANEIAADYSYPTVRVLERLLTWLWNRLYDGVDVRHIDDVVRAAVGGEIVYVPSHRSHIDYLLLAYVVYRQGLAVPHTAAGANLNLPVIGATLRRAGAFFLRRSFKGDALYGAVFRSYFRLILARGFPVEYFVEGTRSRTGRLLKPKLGLLTMTVQSFLADHDRPLVLVPVYFGYEKLIEGQTFIGELRGAHKKQESLGGFFRSLGALRQKFGRVQVSFGEPIQLAAFLDNASPGWASEGADEARRPEWLSGATRRLAREVMVAINEAAVLNPVNLVALVMLSTPRQAIVDSELEAQLRLYLELVRRAPYSSRTGQCSLGPREIIEHCEQMSWITRRSHALGDVLQMDERAATLASYYRNNVVHLFALPSLIASAYNARSELAAEELERFVAELYSCLRGELYLRLDASEVEPEARRAVEAMVELGLLRRRGSLITRPATTTPRHNELDRCARIVEPFLERYYLSLLLLLGRPAGTLTRAALVRECSEVSEQLAMIYSLDSPDLFHASLFDNLVAFLIEEGIVRPDAGGLAFERASVEKLAGALGMALRPAVRQTLSNLVGVELTRPPVRVALPERAASEPRA